MFSQGSGHSDKEVKVVFLPFLIENGSSKIPKYFVFAIQLLSWHLYFHHIKNVQNCLEIEM